MVFRLGAPVVCFGIFLLLTGCESPANSASVESPENSIGDRGAVAVFPAQELSYLPDEFFFLYEQLDSQLPRWLRDQGLATVSPDAVAQALGETNLVQRMNSPVPGEVESAVADLVWRLRDDQRVDFLIVPQVLVRSVFSEAPYRNIRFDGVVRNLDVRGGSDTGRTLQLDVATLNVAVFSARGQPVYYGAGGIALLENGVRAGEDVFTAPKNRGQVGDDEVTQAASVAMQPWLEAGGAGPMSVARPANAR